jgi:hypothetical protein
VFRAISSAAVATLAILLTAIWVAAPAHGARQRGYEGTLQIVHRGTVVGAPEFGYSASGKFSYKGRYRFSGRRIKKPESGGTIRPSNGAWFELDGSGKNSLDMTFEWAQNVDGRTEVAYRRWSGGGTIALTPRPQKAGETRPLRMQTRRGWFYLDLSRLGPVQQPLLPGFPVDVYARRLAEESCDPEPGVRRQQTTFANGLYRDELLAGCPDEDPDVPFPHVRGKTAQQTIWPADVWDPSTSGGETAPALCRPPHGVQMTGLPARTLCGKRHNGRFSGTMTLPAPGRGYPWGGDCPFNLWAPGGLEDLYALTCPQGLDDPFPAWNGDYVGSSRQTVVTWSIKPLR